jgi:hypothetical protein
LTFFSDNSIYESHCDFSESQIFDKGENSMAAKKAAAKKKAAPKKKK